MSLSHSPRIVTAGLEFYYDSANTKKSWKGKPTTNLNPNRAPAGISGLALTYIGMEDGWHKYGWSGTWTGGTYPWGFSFGINVFTGGVDYSTRVFIKTNVEHKFNTFGTGCGYVNAPQNSAGTQTIIHHDDGSYEILKEGTNYVDSTSQSCYFHAQSNDGTSFNNTTDFLWVKEYQFEENSFATPFVDGTRSNTESLLDLTGKQIITATQLTYEADRTFNFNTASDRITLPNDIGYTTTFSQFAWIKTNGTPGNGYHIVFGGGQAELSIPTAGALRIGVYTPTRYVGNLGSGLTDGNWHYVGMVYDPANSYIEGYIDGESVGTVATTGANPNTSFIRTMGVFGSTITYHMNGEIAIGKIYSTALTSTEVKQNFNALRGRFGI